LLVTANWRDFNALREQLPLQIEAFDAFIQRLAE
jgi:hypothetical protein